MTIKLRYLSCDHLCKLLLLIAVEQFLKLSHLRTNGIKLELLFFKESSKLTILSLKLVCNVTQSIGVLWSNELHRLSEPSLKP